MRTVVYLKKSNRPGKKYMVFVDGKTVHFGAAGMSDYTKHKDKERMHRYSARHKRGGETWGKSGLKTAGFWSKWLLWNKPTIAGSKKDISSRFGVTFKSGWPTGKNNPKKAKKSKRKARKSKRKAKKSRRKSRKSRRKAKKSRRKSRKSRRKAKKSRRKSRKSRRKAKKSRKARKSKGKKSKYGFMKKSTDGRRGGEKYERCVMAVKFNQPKRCRRGYRWVGGKNCVNPFAVCTARVGRYS